MLRVTIPRGGSKGDAQEFALRNADWIQKQFEKARNRPRLPEAWQHGTEILFRGNWLQLQVQDGSIIFADQSLPLPLSEAGHPTLHHSAPASIGSPGIGATND